MKKCIEYYEGQDLIAMSKPTMPAMPKDKTSSAMREYADALESYEEDLDYYTDHMQRYNRFKAKRLDEFYYDLYVEEYAGLMSIKRFDVIYQAAFIHGKSEGLHYVRTLVSDYYSIVRDFNSVVG